LQKNGAQHPGQIEVDRVYDISEKILNQKDSITPEQKRDLNIRHGRQGRNNIKEAEKLAKRPLEQEN
jgi:hypothetical protein